MIHFDTHNSYYVLLGVGFNLFAYTLLDLIIQAKTIYNYDCYTVLN